MTIDSSLLERSGSKCELCSSDNNIKAFEVAGGDVGGEARAADNSVVLCETCYENIETPANIDVNHWRCLNDSMWSEHAPVQVMAYRTLDNLGSESWAQDLLTQLYLDEQTLAWATALKADPNTKPTLDSNGGQLSEGDSVTLIKDLVVKGANFTAKRGTMVRNIHLTDDPKHIEGKVNGTQIVLVAAYLKKA